MRTDVKAVIVVASALMVFFIFTRSCVDSSEPKVQQESGSNIAETVNEVEDILNQTPPQNEDPRPRPRNPYVIESPSDRGEPVEIYHGTRPETTSSYVSQSAPEPEPEPDRPKSDLEVERENRRSNSQPDNTQAIANERRLTDQFLFSLAEELRPNMTAAQVRAKAYNIREEASAIRDNAQKLDPQLKSAMLERAKVMEDYATRLSATRGNSRKLRILIHELGGPE